MAQCAICFSKASELTVVTDLGGPQQALFVIRFVYTVCVCVCVSPATVPFLCNNSTKNNIGCHTSIPIDHRCYSCQQNQINGIKTAWSPQKCCKEQNGGVVCIWGVEAELEAKGC